MDVDAPLELQDMRLVRQLVASAVARCVDAEDQPPQARRAQPTQLLRHVIGRPEPRDLEQPVSGPETSMTVTAPLRRAVQMRPRKCAWRTTARVLRGPLIGPLELDAKSRATREERASDLQVAAQSECVCGNGLVRCLDSTLVGDVGEEGFVEHTWRHAERRRGPGEGQVAARPVGGQGERHCSGLTGRNGCDDLAREVGLEHAGGEPQSSVSALRRGELPVDRLSPREEPAHLVAARPRCIDGGARMSARPSLPLLAEPGADGRVCLPRPTSARSSKSALRSA
jgi:hypothetical protein